MKAQIKIEFANTSITTNITPEDIAKIFCEMDNIEMSMFFNTIAKETRKWNLNSFKNQISSVISSYEISNEGKKIMLEIGEQLSGKI